MEREDMMVLLQRIAKLLQELMEIDDGTVAEKHLPKPGPPATEREISELETAMEVKLPPSYRMFLSIHNGWRNWVGVEHLLSTVDQVSPEWTARIERWKKKAWAAGEGGPLEGIVVSAPEGGQSWVYLDASKPSAKEMEAVEVDLTEELHRWKDFADYLQGTEKQLEGLVRPARKRRSV